jgi:WD40 repeat protein
VVTLRALVAFLFATAVVEAATVSANEAIPFYSEKALATADLNGKTLRELALMKATIRARAGLVFLDWWLYDHFQRQSWYRAGRYDESKLSEVDRKNIAAIDRHVSSLSRAELRTRLNALLDRHRFASSTAYGGVEFSGDGRMLLTRQVARSTPILSTWEAATGKLLSETKVAWPVPENVRVAYELPSGRRVRNEPMNAKLLDHRLIGDELVVVTEYDVFIGDPRAARPAKKLLIGPNWNPEGGRDPGLDWACIAPDGASALAYSNASREVSVFDLRAGVRAAKLSLPISRSSRSCSYVDATHALVPGNFEQASVLVDVASKRLVSLGVPPGASAISRDGTKLAVWDTPLGAAPGEISIHEVLASTRKLRTLAGSRGGIAKFSPDGKRLLVGDADGALVLWDVRPGHRTVLRAKSEQAHTEGVVCESHGMLLEAFEDAPEQARPWALPPVVESIAFSPDGKRAAVALQPGSLEVWDLVSGRRVATFMGHEPIPDDTLVEAKLLARRLGEKLPAHWRKGVKDRDPVAHLNALDQPLSLAALDGLSRSALRTLRTGICARRGCPIVSPLLRIRFSGGWYTPAPAYSPNLLNDVERANVRLIQAREAALGGAITEAADAAYVSSAYHEVGFETLPNPPSPARVGFPPPPSRPH